MNYDTTLKASFSLVRWLVCKENSTPELLSDLAFSVFTL